MPNPVIRAMQSGDAGQLAEFMLQRLSQRKRAKVLASSMPEYIRDWLAWMRGADRADNTIGAYARDAFEFGTWLICDSKLEADLGQLAPAHLQDYQAYLGKRLSRASICRKLDALSGFFKYLVRAGVVKSDPLDAVPRQRPKNVVDNWMPEEEATRVLEAVDDPTQRAVFMICYRAGLRRSEVRDLKLDDVDLTNRMLRVYAMKSQTTRHVPISGELAQSLKAYLDVRPDSKSDAFFITRQATPLSKSTLDRWFRSWMNGAALQRKGYRLHDLRHSCATNWVRNGLNVVELKQLLGHASLESVGRYLHHAMDETRAKVDAIGFGVGQQEVRTLTQPVAGGADELTRLILQAARNSDVDLLQRLSQAMDGQTSASCRARNSKRRWVGRVKWIGVPAALDALFDKVLLADRDAFEPCFFSKPKKPTSKPSLRSRAFALYCPFADRRVFPAGVRYCVNTYVGCAHGCRYCHARNYTREGDVAREKAGLLKQARRDLATMEELDLPPVPLHISNSTDPFQEPLETTTWTTLSILELAAENRDRFSQLTILTRNPALAARPEYLSRLQDLAPCQVEVSLTLADDEGRALYEPGAPSVESRLNGVRALRTAGIPFSLRVDPLFPREPLSCPPWPSPALSDYGIERTHSLDDVKQLVRFAAEQGCQKIIVSELKIVMGSRKDFRDPFRPLFGPPHGGKPIKRGTAYRLPDEYIRDHLFPPVEELCKAAGIPMVHCKQNLVQTQ